MIELLIGAVGASVVWFFVWRNNKKKFMETMINVSDFVDRNDTKKEMNAKLNKEIAKLRKTLKAKAEEQLAKL